MRVFANLALYALLVLPAAGMVLAAPASPSVEMGKKIFTEVQPGITGKTCADCHKDGKGLEKAGTRDDLPAMINRCMAGALKGKPLAADSVEMQSLILYIKSLSTGKKAAVGC
jgi:hypothetical protein